MNEREDLWPIMLHRLPARPSMQDWARSVANYLTEKTRLDRQKAHRAGRRQEDIHDQHA